MDDAIAGLDVVASFSDNDLGGGSLEVNDGRADRDDRNIYVLKNIKALSDRECLDDLIGIPREDFFRRKSPIHNV